jgi:EmrB/QacA subfamily drug resistance transporter
MQMAQKNNWFALAALTLATLVIGLDTTVLNVALPTIAGALNASTRQLQWIITAYVLGLAAAMLPGGIIGDRYGRKKVLLAGLTLFLAGSIVCGLSNGAEMLIAMRSVMGVGAAIILPIVMALLPLMFDDEERPKAVAAIAAATGLGVPLGPIVAGYLLDHFAWHSVFWINVPIVILAIIAVLLLIEESRAPAPPRLDIVSALLAVGGVVSLVYAFVEAPGNGWASVTTIGLIALGAALLIVFIGRQLRVVDPLVNLDLFRNARFTGGTLAVTSLTFVFYGLLFTLPLYLQEVRGYDALGVGVRLIPMMGGLVVASIASKRLLDKVDVGLGTVFGTLIVTADLVALSSLSTDTNMWWIGLSLAVFGIGAGIALTAAMDAVLGALPKDLAGTGSAVMNTCKQVGGALGIAILGSILSSQYRAGLDSGMMQGLPAIAAERIRASIVGAMQVAERMGAAGDALSQMAGSSYTHAMSILLLVSAALGIATVLACGLVLRIRPSRQARDQRLERLASGSHD